MFQRWPKRDPNKHYYLVPNEVFNLGLSSHEIAVYNYLLPVAYCRSFLPFLLYPRFPQL